ncbi:hypothetical protein [Pseudovibrio brasiliensis]|uniref:TAFII55 protein conserved region domain-containing protein n=1 Tax=Pseudovibrio brasiliensis TaxID=1898042 RepID=A0ABX8AXC2_9HYPH|nr:hypothetical protein [Pseudovibrio brasiliensis]QUS59218.1 hypothetical protein KGB56_26915 [Pseudovibrio brasiliensis]
MTYFLFWECDNSYNCHSDEPFPDFMKHDGLYEVQVDVDAELLRHVPDLFYVPENEMVVTLEDHITPVSEGDVKEECLRRRKLLVGLSADDPASQLDFMRQNSIEEEMELSDLRRDREWNEEEAARYKQLRDVRAELKAISARSNEIQAQLNELLARKPALDITSDELWDLAKTLPEALAELT